MFPYVINCDWLQVYAEDKNETYLDDIYNGKSLYTFEKLPHSSRHFSEIWNVYNEDNDLYCVIQRKPFSNILSKCGAVLQLVNRELYKDNFVTPFLYFLERHHFRFKSISRIDISFDFHLLYNGLKPESLIKGIMLGKYLKNNQSKVKWNFSSIANVGKPMVCNSCSFGSLNSAVSTKLYNKSLELKEVKQKPYIIESWILNGLNPDNDVWRIEITIKSDASKSINLSTGEIFRLTPNNVKLHSDLEDVFFSYAAKYFAFKHNDGKKNKTRMKDLQIFPTERKPTIYPIRITEESDSTRSDKIFLKKLHHLHKEIPTHDFEVEQAINVISDAFSRGKRLMEYRNTKILNIERKDLNIDDNILNEL